MLCVSSRVIFRSIARACSSLGLLNRPVSDAVDTRIEVDLRIGTIHTDHDDCCTAYMCLYDTL